ncbi:lipid-A-disaccharide synthase [Permianibacter aggregans]|uniref:Lipid-A-disaccharide synthase n=1 Tax=Permianibacter aggregans TaxID=1510150 RepID=A0A4R6UW72_9GAMM|nr:lipid-A-disaccharide synthase [Permianibacter aggregans]QGX38725.1 lipid-A-disaccharide synthase [Permianibacter aggregans]TDQ50526.1 lipid-A-disaccharide synthase [Permianibacter aggregans]
MNAPIRIAVIAGEASGDILGASLLHALNKRLPTVQFEGIPGPRMQNEGCVELAPMERLSVMGIVAILKRLPELLRLRKRLRDHWLHRKPDVFVGIDAPEFNLKLEEFLRQGGVTTVHFVSPSVWAWRKKRIFQIKRAVDKMLILFPFEQTIYDTHEIPASFVGHPLADAYPITPDVAAARAELGIASDAKVLAVLPGSRGSELKFLSEPYIKAMQLLAKRDASMHFIVPLVNDKRRQQFEQALQTFGNVPNLHLVDGQSATVMTAADAVLLASGTATLEAMLLKKLMVVGYRVSGFSYFFFKRLLTIDRFSLPNLLADENLVPELMQHDCTPEKLAESVWRQLQLPEAEKHELINRYTAIHQTLRCNAGERAADAIVDLLQQKGVLP